MVIYLLLLRHQQEKECEFCMEMQEFYVNQINKWEQVCQEARQDNDKSLVAAAKLEIETYKTLLKMTTNRSDFD